MNGQTTAVAAVGLHDNAGHNLAKSSLVDNWLHHCRLTAQHTYAFNGINFIPKQSLLFLKCRSGSHVYSHVKFSKHE